MHQRFIRNHVSHHSLELREEEEEKEEKEEEEEEEKKEEESERRYKSLYRYRTGNVLFIFCT